MKATVLATPPISGSIPELTFDASGGANVWVRFETETGNDWVGVFGGGYGFGGDTPAVPLGDGRTVLVISPPFGYVVDVESRTVIRRAEWVEAGAAIAIPGRDFICVADDSTAWFAHRDHDRPIWGVTPRPPRTQAKAPFRALALDGIRFDHADANTITGKVWHFDGWYALTIDVTSAEARIGAFVARDWSAFD